MQTGHSENLAMSVSRSSLLVATIGRCNACPDLAVSIAIAYKTRENFARQSIKHVILSNLLPTLFSGLTGTVQGLKQADMSMFEVLSTATELLPAVLEQAAHCSYSEHWVSEFCLAKSHWSREMYCDSGTIPQCQSFHM